MLPVRSELLAAGPVEHHATKLSGLTQPMFLVGDDERSRQWLQQRLPELRRLKAVGLVVQVQSIDRLHALRRLAPGVMLSPVSGDDLARRLGLRRYPVLLTPTGIEQ
jgi:integrating conjugative element protein (TIGR03765 family)